MEDLNNDIEFGESTQLRDDLVKFGVVEATVKPISEDEATLTRAEEAAAAKAKAASKLHGAADDDDEEDEEEAKIAQMYR